MKHGMASDGEYIHVMGGYTHDESGYYEVYNTSGQLVESRRSEIYKYSHNALLAYKINDSKLLYIVGGRQSYITDVCGLITCSDSYRGYANDYINVYKNHKFVYSYSLNPYINSGSDRYTDMSATIVPIQAVLLGRDI